MIQKEKLIHLRRQQFRLLPEKAVYWQKEEALLIADLHIGKSGHFRKQGIPVPGEVNTTSLERITRLIRQTSAGHLIVLGDLFHSDFNTEWEQFSNWRSRHADLEFSLVLGNHDVLPRDLYHSAHIHLFNRLTIGPFLLVHDLQDHPDRQNKREYLLSGHIHPAIKLTGKGRQSEKLPCFYFGKEYGVLPAFGAFTGTHMIKPKPGEQIYAVAEDQVLELC